MPNPAARLLTLIQLLQRRPGQKAADLALALGVSVRTLHRYLTMLDEMGLPLYTERGPYGGISLVRGYRLPPLVFTPEEAVVLMMGSSLVSDLWGPLYSDAARGALAKLEAVLPDDQRQEAAWARRTLVTTSLRRPDPGASTGWLEPLRRAAREHLPIWMRYRGSGRAQASERLVDPYSLVFRWGWIYLVGYCHLRQAVRSFRLDRIEIMELRTGHFEIPLAFDAQAFLDLELQNQPAVEARLRFEPDMAFLARANPNTWERLEEQPDGSLVVHLRGPDLNYAASMALAYGPAVTVEAPEELRILVREWALSVAARYSSSG